MVDRAKAFLERRDVKGREALVCVLYCALLALSFTFGYMTPEGGSHGGASALLYGLGYFIVFLAVALLAFPVLKHREVEVCECASTAQSCRVRRWWIAAFVAMVVVWFFVLLAYWPGAASSDSMCSVAYSVGAFEWSDHYPVLYSLLVGVFIHAGLALGNIEWGIALYSAFQIVFMAACCSYVCAWIFRRTRSFTAFVASAAFFVLNPVVARYAITMWKDVLFAAFVMLLVLFLVDLMYDRGRLRKVSTYVKFAALVFLIIMSRGNGLYVVLPVLVLLIVALRKQGQWKRIALTGCSVIVVCMIIQGPVYRACGIAPNEFRQSVGLPLQQVGRVIVDGGDIPDEARRFFEQMMPLDQTGEVFDPHTVDNVKGQEGFDDAFLEDHKLEFLKAYLETGVRNIGSYFVAWRDLTLGYWYCGVDSWVCQERGYYAFDFSSWPVEWPDDADPKGKNLVTEATGLSFCEAGNEDYEVLRLRSPFAPLFSIATMAWFAFGVLCYKVARRDYRTALSLTPLFFLWVTMLIAAPVFCEFRYMYAFHLSLPLVAALLFLKPGSIAEDG